MRQLSVAGWIRTLPVFHLRQNFAPGKISLMRAIRPSVVFQFVSVSEDASHIFGSEESCITENIVQSSARTLCFLPDWQI